MRIRKIWILGMLLCLTAMSGCSRVEDAPLCGVILERGHGSAWGNGFYIEVRTDRIVLARYFPQGAQEQVTCEQIPISPEQWNAICQAVQAMELEQDRTAWWQNLWGSSKLDGTQFRKLTLIWDTPGGEQSVLYRWPADPRAGDLETLLEQLVSGGNGS